MSEIDNSIDDMLRRGVSYLAAGDPGSAKTWFLRAHANDPTNSIANHQLGLLAFSEGDRISAAAHLQQAVKSNPVEPEYLNNLGVALNSLGSYALAQKAFESAIAQDCNYLQAHTNLAASLAGSDPGRAISVYRRALEIDPGCIEARDSTDVACHRLAPQWHFPMMADVARNQAYEEAVRRSVLGRHVLDIGTGSGLLALLAAQAGAASVNTCEAVAEVARVARTVVDKNGYSDRISIHSKHSHQLAVGRELPTRADVLVTETFSSGLLSESVLPTVEHAWANLLANDAQVIPCRAEARGYLIGGPMVEAQLLAPRWKDFDLAEFDYFSPNKIGIHLDRLPHEVLSNDFEIWSFDLTQKTFVPERRAFSVTCSQAGRCVGVAQWLRLQLDPLTKYENRPVDNAGANGWMHVIYRFPTPLNLTIGDVVDLEAVHSRVAMAVLLARCPGTEG